MALMGTVIMAFLLHSTPSILKDTEVAGNVFDVCVTCHPNATCDLKTDGSGGYACNCMYGFVGNGRTHCEDKDECQIGANFICGDHTACHNTHGSYYCTCLSGYAPTNNMPVFIPNDGSYCQDIDECQVQGVCGEGGLCRNTDGNFECECQIGYHVKGGTVPFHPHRGKAFCEAVDCGPPPSVLHAVQVSVPNTSYRSVITYGCQTGFLWQRGDNSSLCTSEGNWTGPSLICEEVDCGEPPAFPHSSFIWKHQTRNTRMGAEVLYECEVGFRHVGPASITVCTAGGLWSHPSLQCEEIVCGKPAAVPNSHMLWNRNISVGTNVFYKCAEGYHKMGTGNMSVCTENGLWSEVTFTCEVMTCGDPPRLPHTGQVWNGTTTVGSSVLYYCNGAFYYVTGTNVSECTTDGYWTKPTVTCKEINCGVPPIWPHTHVLWTKDTRMGAKVFYECDVGYYNAGPGNVSTCTVDGVWSPPYIVCQDIPCGNPPAIPNSKIVWDQNTTFGAKAFYECETGYRNVGLGNVSVCSTNGLWLEPSLICQEISCGPPPVISHTDMQWDKTSGLGSVVQYTCKDGFYQEGVQSFSTCAPSGEWGIASIQCKEINCGVPPIWPHTHVVWTKDTRMGAKVFYECDVGYYNAGPGNVSVCTVDAVWSPPNVVCKARCGHVPELAHADLVWDNESIAIHRCADGYYAHSGLTVSTCGVDGSWQAATLQCREIRYGIRQLEVFNERCLRWLSDGKKEDYRVIFVGSRDYQKPFVDKRREAFSSQHLRPHVCLKLLPATNYTINITAVLARSSTVITTNTTIPAAPVPEVMFRDVEGPLPYLWVHRSHHTLDPICLYEVFVLPVEGTLVFDCNSPKSPHFLKDSSCHGEYVAAQIQVRDVGNVLNFTVGDEQHYGEFYNAPLENGRDYYIILRTTCRWGQSSKHSCVLWAKARGTSYRMRMSALVVCGTISFFGFAVLIGYFFTGYFKN
ncbi:sushi domain-containing protein 1 isoform X2 [Alosa sapidissima]|uniref:sushi domain-containing protein 1 isoform X2 n=1 Tax=Alosa sapidissima TaxID=34773 RepID=UPI001C09CF98|nr:sushi domain-containing protein 1 isoform X2 [Alosa sapidissima]XP_041956595.1 sushi domain-containing protein 1 isoform X2 [Alosa sapidissima]